MDEKIKEWRLIKTILIGIFVLMTMQTLTACTLQPVKVAIIAKLETGSIMGMSTWDQVKFYNDRHQDKAKKIKFYPYSDDGTQEGLKAIYEALRLEGIEIIITAHKSDSALWLEELIEKEDAQILVLAAGSTTDLLTGKDDGILRFVQSASEEQKSAAEYIAKGGYKMPVIIRDIDNYSYANTSMEAFKRFYDQNFHWFDISLSGIDFTVLERQLKTIDYDIAYLLISDYNISSGAVAQMVIKVNPDSKILYNAWMKTQGLLDTAGNSLHQSAMLSHYPAKGIDPVLDKYIEDFKDAFGYVPNTIGLTVYNILDILHEVVEAGHKTPESIKQTIISMGKLEPELMPITIDEYGDATGPFYYIEDLLEAFK